MLKITSYADLIDQATGAVARSVFDSPDIYDVEQRKVFGRSWLFVAHESQIPNSGDFVVSRMAEDSVLVSRQDDGGIEVLLNVCRHRGMRLCRADEGTSRRFTCSYHGWSYDGAGRLTDVPHESDGYRNRLDKTRWSLIRVPHVESFLGLVFACWDIDAMPLAQWLGSAADLLRGAFDRSAAGTEVIGGVKKWRLGGNWKLAAEQFTGDNYHPEASHVSAVVALEEANVFKAGVGQAVRGEIGDQFVQVGMPHGHGGSFPLGDLYHFLRETTLPPELGATLNAEDTQRRLGPLARGPGLVNNTVFPNFSWLGTLRTLRVFHPHGVHEMEVWSWVFVDADWAPEIKDAYRKHSSLSFATTGIFEIDDSENWAEIDAVSAGAITTRVPLNYQMGLGTDTDAGRLGMNGRLNTAFADSNALNFHRYWAELMDGREPRLPDLGPAPLLPAAPTKTRHGT